MAFGRPGLAELPQLPDEHPGGSEESAGVGRRKVERRHVPGGVAFAGTLQPGDDALQSGFVFCNPVLQCAEIGVPGTFGWQEHGSMQPVPLRGEGFVTDVELACCAVMDDPIEQGAFPTCDGGGPKLYFSVAIWVLSFKLPGQGSEEACDSMIRPRSRAGRTIRRGGSLCEGALSPDDDELLAEDSLVDTMVRTPLATLWRGRTPPEKCVGAYSVYREADSRPMNSRKKPEDLPG